MKIAKSGGEVAGDARKAIESRTGRPVITSKNAKQLNAVVTDLIEGVVKEEDDERKRSSMPAIPPTISGKRA